MRDVILFDLDGTLLPLDESVFKKLYFSELKQVFADVGVDPDEAFSRLLSGLNAMWSNTGDATNETVFWEVFMDNLDTTHPVEALKKRFIHFYEHDFDVARPAASPSPHAKALVDMLRRSGKTVVLATNPVFPVAAVRKRLMWAGIPHDIFEHITTYEVASYCKPKQDYYREILGVIGRSADECMMIGNDVREDMVARDMGMETYLVTDCLKNPDDENIDEYDNGSLEAFHDRVREALT